MMGTAFSMYVHDFVLLEWSFEQMVYDMLNQY